MGRFTLEQRWEILKNYFQSECCVAETVRKLRRIFGRNEAPTAAGVRKFIKKVRETGMLVDNKSYPRARPVRTAEIIAAVAQSVRENPKASTRHRAQQLHTSRTSLRRILDTMQRSAGLVIFRKLDVIIEFLMLQASNDNHHWTPPKGHVEHGESDLATALRETEEEAGLTAGDLEIYKDISHTLNYTVKNNPKVVVYWLAKLINPDKTVTLSDEHQDMKWLQLKEAQEIYGSEDMNELLSEFQKKAEKL